MPDNIGLPALSDANLILEAANALSLLADSCQKWLNKAYKKKTVTGQEAQEIFSYIADIRVKVNLLNQDAISAVVLSLKTSQEELLTVIKSGQDAITKITDARKAIDFFANLVVLAGSINAGQPTLILAAIKQIYEDISQLEKEA